jgi:hypothetical protein
MTSAFRRGPGAAQDNPYLSAFAGNRNSFAIDVRENTPFDGREDDADHVSG